MHRRCAEAEEGAAALARKLDAARRLASGLLSVTLLPRPLLVLASVRALPLPGRAGPHASDQLPLPVSLRPWGSEDRCLRLISLLRERE